MEPNTTKYYNRRYDLWGYPQVYRDIELHPLKISEVLYLDLFDKLFQYPKNHIPSKEILRMSYLKFLLYVVQQQLEPGKDTIREDLAKFLEHITQQKVKILDYIEKGKNNTLENVVIRIFIGKHEYAEHDFDIIREIILEQCGITLKYIESYNPELEKFLEKTNNGNYDHLTFNDEVMIFSLFMGKTVDELKNVTYYQFKKQFERAMLLHNYDLYSPLEVSGQIKSKSGGELIKHFLSKIEGDDTRYSGILVSKDKFLSEHPDLADEHGVTRSSLMQKR